MDQDRGRQCGRVHRVLRGRRAGDPPTRSGSRDGPPCARRCDEWHDPRRETRVDGASRSGAGDAVATRGPPDWQRAAFGAAIECSPPMNQTERYYRIDQLIRQRGPISQRALQEALEVSRATLTRDLAYMRDRLNAPIVFDRDAGGYRFEQAPSGPQYELPGLWFNDREILALLTMHRMLEDLDSGGLLGPRVQPLVSRLEALLGSASGSADEVMRRVRVRRAQNRPVAPRWFEQIGHALIHRRRLDIDYYTRSRDARSRREVSPQRLTHYRNAWYLDAWCHASGSMRVFALDAIESLRPLDTEALEVADDACDAADDGYGIYRGGELREAVLRFSAEAARWVGAEVWHPKQRGRLLEDGSWELTLPFGTSTELEMDILRHGADVEVVAPADLRDRVAARLAAALARYRPAPEG
jgi:predicted DNA-binding transcriptional regulator YafY